MSAAPPELHRAAASIDAWPATVPLPARGARQKGLA